MHVYVCGCLCVCLCVQECTLCFKFRNYRLPAFVNVCVCAVVEPIFSFPTSFSAYVLACIPIAPGLLLCAQVRAHERMCARSCDSYLIDVSFCLSTLSHQYNLV